MVNIVKNQLLTITEIARKMSVSRQTIYSWINNGQIKTIRTPGGRLRIPEDQLMAVKEQPKISAEGDEEHYQIWDISGLTPDLSEQMGTKEKYWFWVPTNHWYWDSNGNRFLFKAGRENTGENWAEKIAAELCDLLGLPHASYELANYHELKGVVTPSFVKDRARFVPGNELLVVADRGYEITKRYRQVQHTLRFVATLLQSEKYKLPDGLKPTTDVNRAIDVYVGYLMLDAWIANTDRHHENWGLIFNFIDGSLSLSPTFDHASSLGRIERDEQKRIRLETKDKPRSIERYSERARSALYLTRSSNRPMLTIDAFKAIANIRPKAALFWQNKLKEILVSDTVTIINKIPVRIMSETSREFTIRLLELNRERILRLNLLPNGG